MALHPRSSPVLPLCLLSLAALAACSHAGPTTQALPPAVAARPRLLVQLTVDQLRTDLLTRLRDRLVEGGLRRFLTAGLFYDNARYAHAITETAVGHATLFTGALPSMHGIVGNEWMEAGRSRTAVEDVRYPRLNAEGEIANSPGASPAALRVGTLGDELRLASDGAALVFGVSIKDRAAILPAGHAGKAFWYDERGAQFVTSRYYYPSPPPWLTAFTGSQPLARLPQQWELLLPRESYRARAESPTEQAPAARLGFPHALGEASDLPQRSRAIKHSPYGDELLFDLVSALLAAEPLGKDATPDLLAISFSSTDIVGHAFGPESLEAEDNLLRLDRLLARLFQLLLTRVPERELVVVLSADHGISETPEYLQARGLPTGRHPTGETLVQKLNEQLVAQLGAGADFVTSFVNPCLWLDEAKLRARGLSLEDAEHTLAKLALAIPGMARAIPRSDLALGRIPRNELELLVEASFDRERTGHVYLIPAPGWILATDPTELAAMHGTPYVYDRSVPIALWGGGLAAQWVQRPVDPRDIAPTLAFLAGVKAPSGSSGQLLFEVVEAGGSAREQNLAGR